MPIRSIQRRLLEIDRHSRRVERNVFDRMQGAAFVLSLVAAPFVVSGMESWRVTDERETACFVRVYTEGVDRTLRTREVEPDERAKAWPGVTPLAEIDLIHRISRCGWPFSTRSIAWPFEAEVKVLGAGRDELRSEYMARAEALAISLGKLRATRDETVHLAAWAFSIGVWWMLLSLASAIVITPTRIAWYVFRRGRTVMRQRRIDRSHCPNCGYNARESLLRGRCPECGSDLYERPDVY
ncbi:MAG: hypothetical protein ACKO3W_12000 [bacterium]